MAVDDPKAIDYLGTDDETGVAVLTISDHLDWSSDIESHFWLLAQKICAYMHFVESGQLAANLAGRVPRGVEIQIVWAHRPSNQAERFLEVARESTRSQGIELTHKLLPDEYWADRP